MRAPAAGLATALLLTVGAAATGEETAPPGTADDLRSRRLDTFEADRSVRLIDAEQIWRSNARDLPELLREELGVWMTFATYAGGSPILGGLAGNDILVLLDGVEVNNTAYRFGDLEYLSTIDLHMLERIEIVRGAAGEYGGDTGGPVIRLYTKRDAGPLSPGDGAPAGPVARAFYRYSTVDKSSIAHLEAHRRFDDHELLFGLTTRDVGDLKAGGDIGFQRVTGYEEVSGYARINYFISDRRTFEIDTQILEQENTPRFERTEGGSHLDFELDPRKRALFKLAYHDATDRAWSDRLEAGIYLHQQRQRAFEQRTATPEVRRQTSDNNDVLGLFARAEAALGGAHRIRYGVEATEEEIGAVRRIVDTLSGEEIVRGSDPRRAGLSRDQLTLWAEDRIELADGLRLRVGARWASFSVAGSQTTPAGTFELDADDSGLAGHLSLVWAVREDVRVFAGYDRGFRLPGIDEVSGETAEPGFESLPNSGLVAQTGDAFELGGRYRGERLELAASIFRNELDDMPLLLPTRVGGLPFVDLDGDGIADPGEPLWVRTRSAGEARIDGYELELELHLPWAVTLSASFVATEGDDLLTGTSLAGVPPDYGGLALRWQGRSRRRPWAEALLRWAGDKKRPAPGEAAVEGHEIVTLRAGISLPPRLRLVVSLENRANEAYRPFGSFLHAPGRNLAMAVEYTF